MKEHPEKENDAGLLPLTFYQPVEASSYVEGRDPLSLFCEFFEAQNGAAASEAHLALMREILTEAEVER